jgi:hypothetical protein
MIKCTCAFPCGGTTPTCPTSLQYKTYSVLELSRESDELFGTEEQKQFEKAYDKKQKHKLKRKRIIKSVIKSGLMEDADKAYVLGLLYDEIKKEINKNN